MFFVDFVAKNKMAHAKFQFVFVFSVMGYYL